LQRWQLDQALRESATVAVDNTIRFDEQIRQYQRQPPHCRAARQ
jgi:hypothetical protein